MLKHIVLLGSLASLATLFGCATEVAPEEETATTEGRLLAHEVSDPDPQETEGKSCERWCKNFCDACSGQCKCGYQFVTGHKGHCEGVCVDVGNPN